MTTQITLPPNDRAVGDPNPPGDMNLVSIALAAMGAISWITPTGDATGTDDTANLNAALEALPDTGGTVWLSPGTFYINCGDVVINGPYTYLRGCGRWATLISAVGSGDCIRMYYPDSSYNLLYSGGVLDLTIDGTNAGTGSAGLHYGDMRAAEFRCAVQNFAGTDCIGVHFDNQYAFTEETHGYLWLSNNTQNLVFDVSAPAGTMSRPVPTAARSPLSRPGPIPQPGCST